LSRHQIDLPFVVERHAALPLSVQLGRQLRDAMNDGRVKAGERLPSSRALASALGVSRTVVTAAYEQLYAEGWLEGRHGSGTYVADIAPSGAAPAAKASRGGMKPAPVSAPAVDLRPGVPWVLALDTPAWRRAWRLAATVPPAARPDPRGLPGLRIALVDYLRRSRGVACPVERVLVTRGATNGLDLLAATVLRPGDRVGVEEPGYADARSVLAARGAEVVPCPVDDDGLIVDSLPDDLRIVYTTPSHQYPLGGRLPVPRRQALLAWARRNGALIAEDDYDSEFRYDVAPLPALYGLAPDVTVYLGTTTKTLAPDVGVGWLVARPDLVEAMADTRERFNDRTAVVPQEAVRILLERGDLDRHIRRMRTEYGSRRAAAVEALGHLPLLGGTAGLHLVVELPSETTCRVLEGAAERGVLLVPLASRYAGPPRMHGLIIGYGGATVPQIKVGCSLVRELVGAAAPEPAPCPASAAAGRADRPGRRTMPTRRTRSGAGAPPPAAPAR
jgi:GntR family transcriptional regulator/MocR family aminotransferase